MAVMRICCVGLGVGWLRLAVSVGTSLPSMNSAHSVQQHINHWFLKLIAYYYNSNAQVIALS